MIEYDPQPPFDCGSVAKSDDTVMTRVIEYAALRLVSRPADASGLRQRGRAARPANRPKIVLSPMESPLA